MAFIPPSTETSLLSTDATHAKGITIPTSGQVTHTGMGSINVANVNDMVANCNHYFRPYSDY
jgi:hypothetical protein